MPEALVAVCVTVYVPAVFHTTPVTFCVVAVAGVPLGNVHDQLVGLLFELSVKFTGEPAQTVVVLAVKAAFGKAAVCPLILILSTYKILPQAPRFTNFTMTLDCPAYVFRLTDSLRHWALVGTNAAVLSGAVANVVPPFKNT